MLEGVLKDLFVVFIGYLLYKFVFNFVVPIFRTTRQVRRQMQDIQQHMQEQFRQQQEAQQQMYSNMQQQQRATNAATQNRPLEGDYIDFEEVK